MVKRLERKNCEPENDITFVNGTSTLACLYSLYPFRAFIIS